MKKTLVLLLLVVVATSIAAPAFAADPDAWWIDGAQKVAQDNRHQPISQQNLGGDNQNVSRQNVGPTDAWEPVGDGVSDGMGYFPDFGMAMLYWYGKKVAANLGWWMFHLRP